MTHRPRSLPAFALILLASLACSLPGITLPFGPRGTPGATAGPSPTPMPPQPPTLVETDPAPGEELRPGSAIRLFFDQPMDGASVEAAFGIEPALPGALSWPDPSTLQLQPSQSPTLETLYTITIGTTARSSAGLSPSSPLTAALRSAGPLKVAQVVPAPDTIEVDPGASITVVFNRPVVPLQATGTLPNPLSLDPVVPGKGEWIDTGIYIFHPDKGLPGGVRVQAEIALGLTDVTGVPLPSSYSWSFVTSLPRLISVDPAGDAQRVGLKTKVALSFNQAMDTASVEDNFSLINSLGTQVIGAFAWDSAKKAMTFTPHSALDYASHFVIKLDPGARSANGAGLEAALQSAFETVARPAILSTTPVDGGVTRPYAGVQLQFTGPMDEASLVKALSVSPPVDNFGSYWNEPDRQLSIYGNFISRTEYTLRLSTVAIDPYGTALSSAFQMKFRLSDLPGNVDFMRGTDVFTLTPGPRPSIEVAATNVTEIRWRLYRLGLSDFFAQHRSGNLYASNPSPAGDLIRQWSQPVATPPNVAATIQATLSEGSLATGVYLLMMSSPQTQRGVQARLLVVRQVELVLKGSADHMLAWAVDLGSGKPVSGLELGIVDENGASIGSARTGTDGVGETPLPPPSDPYPPVYVMAGKPGDPSFALTGTIWSDGIEPYQFGVSQDITQPQELLYLYTDRPIYRPGQSVRFRGVLRKIDEARYRLPDTKAVTVTLRDANGQVAGSFQAPVSDFGTFDGEFALADGASLGNYTLETQFGSEYFQVAAYRKPEFTVTVAPSASDVGLGDPLQAKIQATYYFGGPVGGASVQWSAWAATYFPPDVPQPIDWFERVDHPFGFGSGETLAQGEGTTGPDGTLMVTIPTKPNAPAPLAITIEATITDAAGLPVTGRASAHLHPAAFYIGVTPKTYIARTGEQAGLAVESVDWQGKPLPGKTAALTIDRVTWKQVVDPDGKITWESQSVNVSQSSLTTGANGEAVSQFTPASPGSYHVHVEAHDAAGRTTDSGFTLWVPGPGAGLWRQPPAGRLALVPDRETYEPGQTARILVPSPFSGPVQALVTVERAQVLSHEVRVIDGQDTTLEIPIQEIHAPNVYVSVVLVAPGTNSSAPALAAGFLELSVDPKALDLQVSLTADPTQAGPRDNVTYQLRAVDSQGKPVKAEFSLGLADLAALSLADPNSPTPMKAFYDRQLLRVRTGASLAISAVGGPGLPMGGGMGGGGDGAAVPEVRQEFPDTAFWNAHVVTDANGQATVKLTLPDNLTTWRMDARGVTTDTLVGNAMLDLIATKPLLIRPVTPRFFTAGDAATVAAVVNNNTTQSIDVEVGLTAVGADITASPSPHVTVPAGGQQRVTWMLSIQDVDSVDLTFRASGGGLQDASKPTIGAAGVNGLPVKRYAAPDTFATAGSLVEVGDRVEAISLPRRYDATQGALAVRVEPSLGTALDTALDVLEYSPYDSTEQVVSRFLPNLAAYQAAQDLGQPNPALADRLKRTMDASLQTLNARQQQDGGWGWWTEGPSDAYVTAYVVYALSLVSKADLPVSLRAIDSAVAYLNGTLVPLDSLSEASMRDRQAFVLFALDAASATNVTAVQTLVAARTGMSFWSRALLAMTLFHLDPTDPGVAALTSDLESGAIRSATGAHWEDPAPDPRNLAGAVRTTAQALQAMILIQPQNPLNPDAVRWLLAARSQDGAWESTHDGAWAVMALSNWVRANRGLQSKFAWSFKLNGSPVASGSVDVGAPTAAVAIVKPIADLFGDRPNQLVAHRGAGDGALYYTAHLTVYRPVEDVTSTSRGLTVSRAYFLDDGSCGSQTEPCAPAASARAGDHLLVRVSLVVPSDQYYVIVEDPFPAGTEPVDTGLLTSPTGPQPPEEFTSDVGRKGWGWWAFTRAEVHDDRTMLFAEHLSAGTYQYTYRLVATFPGEFRVLPPRAWDLYFPEVNGQGAGSVYTIQP